MGRGPRAHHRHGPWQMPGEHTSPLCLDKDTQALTWAAPLIRPRHLGHMVMRPSMEGLTNEAMPALVMSKVWAGLEYLPSNSLASLIQ